MASGLSYIDVEQPDYEGLQQLQQLISPQMKKEIQ